MGRMANHLIQVEEDAALVEELIESLWEDVLAKCVVTESRSGEQSQLLVEHIRSLREAVDRLAGEVKIGMVTPSRYQAEKLGIDASLSAQIAEAVRLSLDAETLFKDYCSRRDEEASAYLEEEYHSDGDEGLMDSVDEPEPWVPDRVEELD